MFDFIPPQLDPLHPKRHLTLIDTPFGERSVYDSLCFCNRCGSCQQTCPTYWLTGEETFSPRGRNQLARLIAEKKLDVKKNRELLAKAVNSCLLCGRCTQACAGKIPTAEHMLELRRTLQLNTLPKTLFTLLSWRTTHPRLFSRAVRLGAFLRASGLIFLARKTGISRLFGFGWVNYVTQLLPRRTPALEKSLKEQGLSIAPEKPTLIYLPSLEAEFCTPDLAASVLKAVNQKYRTALWTNTPSGLFDYVYGDVSQSRRAVKRLIARWQKAGQLPLLTDSIDVYLFLLRAPQLFAAWPKHRRQAQEFAKQLKFVTDILPHNPANAEAFKNAPVRLDKGTLFLREGKAFDKAQTILKTLFKKNFVECLYKDADAPAFGYSFVRFNRAPEVWLRAVQSAARTQTGTVFTLSGLSALELNFYLKKFYPSAKADHFVRLNG